MLLCLYTRLLDRLPDDSDVLDSTFPFSVVPWSSTLSVVSSPRSLSNDDSSVLFSLRPRESSGSIDSKLFEILRGFSACRSWSVITHPLSSNNSSILFSSSIEELRRLALLSSYRSRSVWLSSEWELNGTFDTAIRSSVSELIDSSSLSESSSRAGTHRSGDGVPPRSGLSVFLFFMLLFSSLDSSSSSVSEPLSALLSDSLSEFDCTFSSKSRSPLDPFAYSPPLMAVSVREVPRDSSKLAISSGWYPLSRAAENGRASDASRSIRADNEELTSFPERPSTNASSLTTLRFSIRLSLSLPLPSRLLDLAAEEEEDEVMVSSVSVLSSGTWVRSLFDCGLTTTIDPSIS